VTIWTDCPGYELQIYGNLCLIVIFIIVQSSPVLNSGIQLCIARLFERCGESCRWDRRSFTRGAWWLDRSSFMAGIVANNASVICISNQKWPAKPQSARRKHSYPSVLTLQYQNTSDSFGVYVERCWVWVSPRAGTRLVTLGDIMKVWSNGEYESTTVGRLTVISDKAFTSMALIYSPPTESIIYLIPELLNSDKRPRYSSFSFKDYAARLRKQRLLFNNPVERYRIL